MTYLTEFLWAFVTRRLLAQQKRTMVSFFLRPRATKRSCGRWWRVSQCVSKWPQLSMHWAVNNTSSWCDLAVTIVMRKGKMKMTMQMHTR